VILAFVEHDGNAVDELSLDTLAFGRDLGERLGTPIRAVLIGNGTRRLAELLPAYGVSKVHVVEDEHIDDFAPEAWAESIVQLMTSRRPQVVMAAGSDRGNEVMAHVSARVGLPMAANCTAVDPEDLSLVTRVRWGGSLVEQARLDGAVKLLTVVPSPGEVTMRPAAGDLEVESFTPKLTDKELRVRITARVPFEAGKISLPKARVVVGGGRGVGSAEGFAPLDELAQLLGGVVGCSRAVTSLGWRPHADQIGQTGTRIAPELYIACGISGAIQHMVGCKRAKRILVINTDAQAPVLAHADYAVLGDVQAVVAALNAEIRKARSEAA
jgi:electron transfer flavoprotein alpha subunit